MCTETWIATSVELSQNFIFNLAFTIFSYRNLCQWLCDAVHQLISVVGELQ